MLVRRGQNARQVGNCKLDENDDANHKVYQAKSLLQR